MDEFDDLMDDDKDRAKLLYNVFTQTDNENHEFGTSVNFFEKKPTSDTEMQVAPGELRNLDVVSYTI